MADIKDMRTIAGCLEQLVLTDRVARAVDGRARRGEEKWVTCAWLGMWLQHMGIKCNNRSVSVLLNDLDVRRRDKSDGRVSLTHLRTMALDGEITQYIKDLEYQTGLVMPSLPPRSGHGAAGGAGGPPGGGFAPGIARRGQRPQKRGFCNLNWH